MKTNSCIQLLVAGVILCCQTAFGQLPAIDSVKLIPDNPTAGDEILLIYYATFSSGGCDLDDHSVIVQGNQLTLNLEHTLGAATYICHDTDTISLGILSPGDYELDINLMISPTDAIKDHVNVTFSVGSPLGMAGDRNSFHVSIHPNPFRQELLIEANARIEAIELHTISGQKICGEFSSGFTRTMDLSDLENGIYLLTLTDQHGNRYSKRIIKTL